MNSRTVEPWLVLTWDAAEMLEDPDLPDDTVVPEKSVARFYAEAHPDPLDDFQKRYIAEISAQPYSFFQVIDVKPGRELTFVEAQGEVTAQKEVKRRLKNKAVYKNAVMTSVEKMLEEQGQGGFMGTGPGPGGQALSQEEMMQIPELKEKMAEMAEKHWERWMDTPLRALGDLTPRQAADDPIGREKLEGLFLSWEAMASKSTDNLFSPDTGKLK